MNLSRGSAEKSKRPGEFFAGLRCCCMKNAHLSLGHTRKSALQTKARTRGVGSQDGYTDAQLTHSLRGPLEPLAGPLHENSCASGEGQQLGGIQTLRGRFVDGAAQKRWRNWRGNRSWETMRRAGGDGRPGSLVIGGLRSWNRNNRPKIAGSPLWHDCHILNCFRSETAAFPCRNPTIGADVTAPC